MYRTREETQWTVREDLDMDPSEKRKKRQLLPKLKKKKKSQGDIDLTQTTIFLYRCVMERKYEESEYFVHG